MQYKHKIRDGKTCMPIAGHALFAKAKLLSFYKKSNSRLQKNLCLFDFADNKKIA